MSRLPSLPSPDLTPSFAPGPRAGGGVDGDPDTRPSGPGEQNGAPRDEAAGDEETVEPGFDSMAAFAAIPRVTGLALRPDGGRLVAAVSALNAERTKWLGSLWEIDPDGRRPARRLTRGVEGESQPVFATDGTLLFTSSRKGPDADKDADGQTLWALPETGEAVALLRRPGGFSGLAVAADADRVAYASSVLGDDPAADAEAERRKRRKDHAVSAVLHDSYPIRYWDHDLGPARPRLFAGPGPRAGDDGGPDLPDAVPVDVDVAGLPNHGLGGDLDLSRDGRRLAFSVQRSETGPWDQSGELVVLDLGPADDTDDTDDTVVERERRWFTGADVDAGGAVLDPTGRRVALAVSPVAAGTPDRTDLVVLDLESGEQRTLTGELDRWPSEWVWTPDGDAVLFTADDRGHRPVFRAEPGDAGQGAGEPAVVRLTADGSYSSLQVAPDGTVYALRDHVDSPPQPVRLDPRTADQQPQTLPAPGGPDRPGTLERVTATASDGVEVPAWLVLPEGASPEQPAPLLLWIHGGPHSSWNSWSWRWNPWLMAAKGYAVLLPDPGLSTGYGSAVVGRGYAAWGAEPYTDLMAITDAVEARPDVDARRTVAMGGSFGGYMANWVAGQTDRFSAIVTHASLWDLDHFAGTTDFAPYWMRQFGDPLADGPFYAEHSPHRFLDRIRTPMLVIHGDRDYRVPIGQGLRLWADLQRAGVPSRFLYYPDENHWVLTPGNHGVWYETVWAFLAEHVKGEEFLRPDLL